jgi:hypothetical protein
MTNEPLTADGKPIKIIHIQMQISARMLLLHERSWEFMVIAACPQRNAGLIKPGIPG